jgi:hypothetical protein
LSPKHSQFAFNGIEGIIEILLAMRYNREEEKNE